MAKLDTGMIHDRGRDDNADNAVEGKRVVIFKQCVDGFGQQDDCDDCSDASWYKDIHVKVVRLPSTKGV